MLLDKRRQKASESRVRVDALSARYESAAVAKCDAELRCVDSKARMQVHPAAHCAGVSGCAGICPETEGAGRAAAAGQ